MSKIYKEVKEEDTNKNGSCSVTICSWPLHLQRCEERDHDDNDLT